MRTKSGNGIAVNTNMKVSLDIRPKDDLNGMKNTLTLRTIVEACWDDGTILILMPIHQGYHYPLPQDEPILMKFFVKSKLYALLVQFEERVEQGGFMFAKMRRISKIEQHNQRDCYRLPCSMPVMVERLWQSEREKDSECKPDAGRVLDFSDGGMLFATNDNIENGEKITLTFDIGETETVDGLALRTESVEDWTFLFKVAAQFKNTDIVQKHRFYMYIVEKQLEEHRRWILNNEPLY